MKFSLVTLNVNDMDKALKFYHSILGMPIVRRQPAIDGRELIFLGKEGDINLELVPSDINVSYNGFSIGFNVENMENAKEKLLKSGYPIKHEFSPSPTTMICFLEGPNGEEVELIEYK